MRSSAPIQCVLMTADAVGGVWQYALELADGFGELGIKTVLAVTGRPPTADQIAAARANPSLHIAHQPFRLEWMDGAEQDILRTGDWLLRLEREHRPDVVHLNGFSAGALPWRAPHLVVAHSCSLSWWSAVRRTRTPETWRSYADRVSAGLRGADLVVSPTAAFLAEIERIYGRLPASQVIWNGRTRARFRPGTKKPCVLAAGRLWDEAKNLSALDAVAPRLSWPVFAAGDLQGPDGGAPVLRNVRPLGNLAPHELQDWFSQAAVFALPARYEPFGLAVLEAALSGCALVLGNIPTFRELWGGAASFVDPEDHEALERALNDLAADERKLRRLSEAATARAGDYSAEQMVEGYLRAYTGLQGSALRPALARA